MSDESRHLGVKFINTINIPKDTRFSSTDPRNLNLLTKEVTGLLKGTLSLHLFSQVKGQILINTPLKYNNMLGHAMSIGLAE